MQDNKKMLTDLIVDFIDKDPVNRMGENFGDEKMWATPRVGFAYGADELFKKYKTPEICGLGHWLPEEIFAKVYPDSQFSPEDLTVVSWVLPQTEKTKASLRVEKENPSERWSRARVLGEPINDKLREYLQSHLRSLGYEVVAPVLHPEWERLDSVARVYTSKWSERHIAHTAGHGTFGLCDALITPLGKAVRLGSIVIKAKIEPDKREYSGPYDYCLHYTKGTCGVCIKRCPIDAITKETGHDKKSCRVFLRGKMTEYVKEHYDLDGYSCGFCQTAVPCENGIPR